MFVYRSAGSSLASHSGYLCIRDIFQIPGDKIPETRTQEKLSQGVCLRLDRIVSSDFWECCLFAWFVAQLMAYPLLRCVWHIRCVACPLANACLKCVCFCGCVFVCVCICECVCVCVQMTDHNAFGILNSILCYVPSSKFPEFLPVLTNAALDRCPHKQA